MENTVAKKNSQGDNVRRWREWRGISQEVLADRIGVSQATLSGYENSETLKTETADKLAKALDIPKEAITEMNNNNSINIFSGPWHENSIGLNQIFNPVEKIIELYEEKVALYERMLKAEQEKVELLQEVLRDRKR